MFYETENKACFRDWNWEEYKFKNDGSWHELDDVVDYNIGRRYFRQTYLESVNADEVYGVKNARYFNKGNPQIHLFDPRTGKTISRLLIGELLHLTWNADEDR